MRRWLTILIIGLIGITGLNGNAFSMGQAPKNIQAAGKVTEVNSNALTVKVAFRTGDAVVLQINEKTKMTKGGKNIILTGLKKDDEVTVTYAIRRGKKVALEITAQERVVAPQKAIPIKSKR